ncbi:restriction endonuclease subunit S [Sphingopyxis sp. P1IMeth2]|uniref:restriction endonuclease subunit S n=1 Tax=Sphingopyxis sp. P1IMeth2 TaxID=1892848 RepID=UPI001648CE4E|nr:restriction endonuclease subunit S [Sphingopyxis sp. P1IMeth2]
MAGEWQTQTLRDFCRKPNGGIQTGPFGSQLHRADYVDQGVPVIMPTNIQGGRLAEDGIARISEAKAAELKRHRVRLGDIIFSRRGEVDKCAVVTQREVDWLCGTGCLLARVDPKHADPRYIGYHIGLPETRAWLRQNAVGLVMPNLNTGILESIPIHAPNRIEQEKIADLLASLDAKIDLNRKMAATLEGMARGLFESWFVDFDPVHAKAAGHDAGLPADIAALFPDGFNDEGLPLGWSHEPLLSFADLISGGTPKTENAAYWNGPIPWASAKDVSQCGQLFLRATERTITERGLDESSTKIVPAYSTVVVARGATTGRNCLFGIDMAMNQTCYALKSHEGFDFWFNLCFRNEINRIIAAAHGSAFDTITTATLQNASIVPANDGIRNAFEARVSPIYQRVLAASEEETQLQELRDYLIPKLISGELRVDDAEDSIAAA